jgi:hypothetical protein
MGDTFVYATRCIPNVCPWPYVPHDITVNSFSSSDQPAWDKSPLSIREDLLCSTRIHLGGTIAAIAVIAVLLLVTYGIALSFAAIGQDEALTSNRRR